MHFVLENSFFRLVVDAGRAEWSLAGQAEKGPVLEGIRTGLDYHTNREQHRVLETWPSVEPTGPETLPSPHGPLRQITLSPAPDPVGLRCQITYALSETFPILLWKLAVENHGPHPVFLDRFTLLQAGDPPSRIIFPKSTKSRLNSTAQSPISNLHSPLSNLHFFSNGWQSWSYTGAYTARSRFRRTRLGFLREPTDINAGTPRPSARGHFASDMFGVLGDSYGRCALLAGFLSQRQHFGSLEACLNAAVPALRLWANGDGVRLDQGAHVETDWACISLLNIDDPDPLGPYLDAVAREHGLLPLFAPSVGQTDPQLHASRNHVSRFTPHPVGWCSWYQYSSEQYTGELSAQDIRRNLEAMSALRPRLPLEILQIDDGFEAQVGDWFHFGPSFPDGVTPLAGEIRAAGLTPGLWLAPFIVHPRARLAVEHPDWLLRGRNNRPANAGYLWNSFATALDLTHPAAMEYAADVVHTAVHRWGFPYLKLDFLYAAALPGRRHDPTCTRAQTLRAGLEALRAAAGEEAFLVGCGCPLGPAIGLVEAMRIGPDTARRWNPAFNGIETYIKAEPNLPSARNAIHNALTRAPLHHRWWVNDPDCLLLRPQTRLTLAEVQTAAAAISLTGGSLLLSDDLAALPPDRLRIAEVLLPVIDERPRILDWLDSETPQRLRVDLQNGSGAWHLLALFNWEDRARDLTIKLNEFDLHHQAGYYAREFWSSELYRVPTGSLPVRRVPAHGVLLLAVRTFLEGQPQYLGSDLHISQGLEVEGWQPAPGGLRLSLKRPGSAWGHFDLSLPRMPKRAVWEGLPVDWERIAEGCCRFQVSFEASGSLELEI